MLGLRSGTGFNWDSLDGIRPFHRASWIVALVWLAGVTLAVHDARAVNMLQNGTFDTGVPKNATGGGWTSATIAANPGGWNGGIGNPAPAFLLNDSGFGSDPRIYQTVSGFVVGEMYQISGEYGLGYGGGNPQKSFEGRVDGVAVLSIGPHPDHDPSSGTYYPFRPFSTTFTATATSHQIMFAAECNGSDHDYFVDNLKVEMVTIPVESSTWGKVKALYR